MVAGRPFERKDAVKKTTLLRKALKEKTLVAMGAYDAFSAMLIERAGVDVVYVSGYVTTASFMGLPDLGLMSSTERIMIARQIARRVEAPVIVDAEEGYGNALHVMDTVQQFEMAGVAGIQLDDEEMPTQCQMFTNVQPNKLISVEEMCGKIHAALDARTDPDFLIMVRSDVFGTVRPGEVPKSELMAEIIERANAYAEAGAEMIFVYAQTPEEAETYARSISAPLCGLLGFVAPMSVSDFEQLGYQLVVCPLPVLASAAKGVQEALKAFQEKREWNAMVDLMLPHDEIKEILQLQSYSDLAAKYEC
jgi:2-methylisocitrate lyase-like PEP mutase family enzyme